MLRPQDIIERKRDGHQLSADEIGAFIDGVCHDTWADYQIAALLMAMFVRGLDRQETDQLTRSMLHSGEILKFDDLDGPVADKHSTGGVGDKTSLIIAPLAAACGVFVPMISGRGLGHTGGTLDKLESIPGYNVKLTIPEIHSVIRQCGFAMAGQTAEIAPADRKMYALRDATATVPYVPLIVGSIMSKKLAEGLDALVLDVKTGSGAFMKTLDDAEKLARALVDCAHNFGVRSEAIISDMSQPLGRYVGNAHEVYECIRIMRGESDEMTRRTRDLSIELTARMLVLTKVADDIADARSKVTEKLDNGEAFERFRHNVAVQGGDVGVCDEPSKLLDAKLITYEIRAVTDGNIEEVNTHLIGTTIAMLGGGRNRAEDSIDHAVGFSNEVSVGQKVAVNDVIGMLYCRDSGGEEACRRLSGAYKTGNTSTSVELIPRIVS